MSTYEISFVSRLLYDCENDSNQPDKIRSVCKIYSLILEENDHLFEDSTTVEDVEKMFDFLNNIEIKSQDIILIEKINIRDILIEYARKCDTSNMTNYYMISLYKYYQ